MTPHGRDDVLRGLGAFFRAPAPGRWAPAGHLRHLTLTHRRVTQGLGMPRPALRVMFGAPSTHRPYPEVVTAYRAALAAGGTAPDRYVPAPDTDPTEATRTAVLDGYARGAEALRAALARWPDAALDTHALPHDLLGRLSVRELTYFTHYHDLHHLRGVQAALEPS